MTTSNQIVLENQLPGTPQSVWDLSGPGSTNIEGFTTDISINHADTVNFKINTDSTNYQIEIYRLGYYGGDGARLVTTIQHQGGSAIVQPVPLTDPTTGLVDAGNWQVTDSWAIPADAVSGVYIAKLVREDGTFGENHIPFIVRNDGGQSDIVFQTSDTTWQAYNSWGGHSLYDGTTTAVSYNRPMTTRYGGHAAGPWSYLFGAEYPAIYWLEANGYDVSYIAGVDTARSGSQLLNYRAFLSVGHDEYWSAEQRASVQAAVDAGVNLAFFSGNEVFWKTEWKPSIDGSSTPYRTMVSYKTTNTGIQNPDGVWTGTWRDPNGLSQGGGLPENALTGQLFTVNDPGSTAPITITYGESQLRFWRDTSIADIQYGHSASLVPNLLAYEFDENLDNGFRPAGIVDLSSTTASVSSYLQDYGGRYAPGIATHSLTLYRNSSGALVFNAGTVFWSWALDTHHDRGPNGIVSPPADPNVQQAMVNLFADMGVQPQTLMSTLFLATRSNDHAAPVSTINSPNGTIFRSQPILISGTAADAGGGIVAAVEISTDGGATWHRANLDSPTGPQSGLFSSSDTPAIISHGDPNPVELGVKFVASQSGTITGLQYYKGPGDTGTHDGSLWTSTGTLLVSATFQNEASSGWQSVNFADPISVAAGTTYVASYHSNGYYDVTRDYFATDHVSGVLTGPSSSSNGGNGVYAYGPTSSFPTNTYQSSNYWVDVLFDPSTNAQTWTYSWIPTVAGTHTVKTRAVDDSVNLEALSGGIIVNVDGNSSVVTLFSSSDTPAIISHGDPNPVELGVKFVASQSGTITGLQYYKGPGDTGTHDGSLWTSTGTLLVSATFQNEASSGWQSVNFADPISVAAGTTYVASYHSNGYYDVTRDYFATDHVSGVLTGPSSSSNGGNGVYAYGPTSSFPTNTYQSSNYWVDVLFDPVNELGLFSSSDTPAIISHGDPNPVELGVKFVASQSGTITGLQYYKGPGDTGTHDGSLWTSTGTLLVSATFQNEASSGWQSVNFADPISVAAGTTYVASYHSNGYYDVTRDYFATDHVSGVLTGPSSSSNGGNGVYAYGPTSSFPTNTYQSSNYWVDVIFQSQSALFTS